LCLKGVNVGSFQPDMAKSTPCMGKKRQDTILIIRIYSDTVKHQGLTLETKAKALDKLWIAQTPIDSRVCKTALFERARQTQKSPNNTWRSTFKAIVAVKTVCNKHQYLPTPNWHISANAIQAFHTTLLMQKMIGSWCTTSSP
jgi:hypothetical protein